jgi:hypothetical protein
MEFDGIQQGHEEEEQLQTQQASPSMQRRPTLKLEHQQPWTAVPWGKRLDGNGFFSSSASKKGGLAPLESPFETSFSGKKH